MNSFFKLSTNKIFNKYLKLCATYFSYSSRIIHKSNIYERSLAPISKLTISFFPIAYCLQSKEQVKFKKDEKLTNEYLIKQSCSLSIDACTQLLTHTTNALIEYSQKFRKNTEKLICLLEIIIEHNGQSCEELDLEVIEKRSCIKDDLSVIQELESLFEYVQKMSTDAAEVAYLAGVEFISTSMCERINSANQQLENEKLLRKKIETVLLQTNEKLVKCTKK